ncbi:hypothetical protein NDU88_005653 [Pleurodeles waltl]|uniref:Uncharacterized protein n=1 Tax=Pleurodeles waltl TaxID=8319 RepID=A0AAV7VP59_PLEWA|nr:hypothetical protein NDU88_005653 [Pleurodeles waltl]
MGEEEAGVFSCTPSPRRTGESSGGDRDRPPGPGTCPLGAAARGRRWPSGTREQLPCPGAPSVTSARGSWRNWAAQDERRRTAPGHRTERTEWAMRPEQLRSGVSLGR